MAKTNKRDATASDVAKLRAEVRALAKRVKTLEAQGKILATAMSECLRVVANTDRVPK